MKISALARKAPESSAEHESPLDSECCTGAA